MPNRTEDRTIREQARRVANDVLELGGIAKDSAKQVLHKGRTAVGDGQERFAEGVKTHPLRSVCIAAGAGILLGLFLRR